MKDFIIRTNIHGNKSVNDLAQSLDKGHYEKIKDNSRLTRKLDASHVGAAEGDEKQHYADEDRETAHLIENKAPIITLNVQGSVASRAEMWNFAILGTVLQAFVLGISALSVYSWKWKISGNSLLQYGHYGFPCFSVGTIAVIVGLVLCSHIIEGTTTEQTWQPIHEEGTSYQVVKLQKCCTVSEQQFDSYAIFNSASDPLIRVSRLNNRNFNTMAAIGTALSIAGFIVQFVGLRALHWSSTIMQLVATLVLTAAIAWVRRGLAKDPIAVKIPAGHELSWLAMRICNLRSWEILTGAYDPNERPRDARAPSMTNQDSRSLLETRFEPGYFDPLPSAAWQSSSGGGPEALAGVHTNDHFAFHHEVDRDQLAVLKVWKKLETLMPEADPTVRMANALATALEKTISLACNDPNINTSWENTLAWILQGGYFNWILKTAVAPHSGDFRLTGLVLSLKAQPRANNDELTWTVDLTELHAVLSLWAYSLINRTPEQNKKKPHRECADPTKSGSLNLTPGMPFDVGLQLGSHSSAELQIGRPLPVNIGQDKRFARILSSETCSDSRWAQQARRWMGGGVATIGSGAPNGAHF